MAMLALGAIVTHQHSPTFNSEQVRFLVANTSVCQGHNDQYSDASLSALVGASHMSNVVILVRWVFVDDALCARLEQFSTKSVTLDRKQFITTVIENSSSFTVAIHDIQLQTQHSEREPNRDSETHLEKVRQAACKAN